MIMNRKLLIADDEVHIRMLLEQTLEDLEEEGVEMIFADNGVTALELIKTEHPRIVFLDVMMPKMNGMEICATVKNDLAQLEQAAKIKDERIRQLEESTRHLQQNLDAVSRVLSLKPTLSQIENALAIPTEALIPEMDGERVFIYKGGKASSIKVNTGLRTESKIQITSGLKSGDTLITTGILQLRQGLPVQLDSVINNN